MDNYPQKPIKDVQIMGKRKTVPNKLDALKNPNQQAEENDGNVIAGYALDAIFSLPETKTIIATNGIWLGDRQRIPLAMSKPIAGNHNDLYDIEIQAEVVTATLEKVSIPVAGLFMNADADINPKDFGNSCGEKEINVIDASTSETETGTETNTLTKNSTMKDMPWNIPICMDGKLRLPIEQV